MMMHMRVTTAKMSQIDHKRKKEESERESERARESSLE